MENALHEHNPVESTIVSQMDAVSLTNPAPHWCQSRSSIVGSYSPSNTRPSAQLYAFNLPNRIPEFPLPLRSKDAEPLVDLQRLVNEIYEQGSYHLRLDYTTEPVPALSEADAGWVDRVLRQQRLR